MTKKIFWNRLKLSAVLRVFAFQAFGLFSFAALLLCDLKVLLFGQPSVELVGKEKIGAAYFEYLEKAAENSRISEAAYLEIRE